MIGDDFQVSGLGDGDNGAIFPGREQEKAECGGGNGAVLCMVNLSYLWHRTGTQ